VAGLITGMHVRELRIDVTAAAGASTPLANAATAYLPEHPPSLVVVAYPGGGYSRRYFDLPEPGYSQAHHHVARGVALVACDHLGVGDSDLPAEPVSWEGIAAAGHATALGAVAELGLEGVPAVGIGQSYGGLLLTIQQAEHGTFGAVAVLGWSGLHTVLPEAPPDYRGPYAPFYGFHFDDVPAALVEADLDGYPTRPPGKVPPWGASTMPGGPAAVGHHPDPLGPGAVAHHAARIDVPIFIGNGERDVCPDPWREPVAYRASNDVTVFTVPRMAHMHNFASTRSLLWDRVLGWAACVTGT